MQSRLLTTGRLSVKMKLIVTISIMLISGIIISNYYSYKAYQNYVRRTIVNTTLPMTSESIYNEIFSAPDSVKNPAVIIPRLKAYRELYGSTVYLVDIAGIVQTHPNEKLSEQADIRKLKGIREISDTILSSKTGNAVYDFSRNDEHIFLTVRYIPEINRFLFVEADENSRMTEIYKNTSLNLLFDILLYLAVIAFIVYVVNYYERKLEHMSVTDELTGAGNRREFDSQFRKSVYNYNRNGTPFSLIIFDIDNFKNLNDTMGHITGDSSIKTVAMIARDAMRLTDLLVRWGGDEFIILAQGDVDSAFLAAERIRKQVESSDFFKRYSGRNLDKGDLTISCGVSEFRKGDTLDSILARADAALYRAKVEGRNRIYKG